MRLFLQRIYFIYGLLVFVLCMVTFTMLILFTVALVSNKKWAGKVAYFFLRCWGFGFSSLAFIFYRFHGLENVQKNQSYVFTSNHNSFLDGIAICLSIPNDFRPLGKIELTKVPIFGWMYRYVVILVDRNSAESRQKSMLEMKHHMREGISVLVFPEGTMNKTSSLMQPFKNGAFTLALETQSSVVPMVMWNTKKHMPRVPKFALCPGIIDIHFLPPIETRGMVKNDLETLKREVFEQMKNKLLELQGKAVVAAIQ